MISEFDIFVFSIWIFSDVHISPPFTDINFDPSIDN